MSDDDKGQAAPVEEHPEGAVTLPAEIIPGPGGALEAWGLGGQRLKYWCNWKLTDLAGKSLLTRCMTKADLKSDDVLNKVMHVTGLLMHPVTLISKRDGEVRLECRAVLVLEDDKTVGFVSRGVVKSLQLITDVCGLGPWKPALPLLLKSLPVEGGGRFFTIELAAGQINPTKKGK